MSDPDAAPLLRHEDDLVAATVVDRPNRFVVRVRFDGRGGDRGESVDSRPGGAEPERAFLGDPGALSGIVEPGAEVLCSAADDPERATDHDAISAVVGDVHVSLRAALANDLFEAALERGALHAFEGYAVARREPSLPDHGRTDFALERPDGEPAYVEVKSATYVEDGVAKFPDRQTERGRRHLRSLRSLVESGVEAHVVFVVQRPDVSALRPYREVDPEFADLLGRVRETGVGVHAIATAFDPPDYRLRDPDLPVELA